MNNSKQNAGYSKEQFSVLRDAENGKDRVSGSVYPETSKSA